MANHLFYIKNTVDERNTCINGYFSTLDKAKEALKDCCDWYRSKGTGRIYRVDMDTLDPDSILICTDDEFEEWAKSSDDVLKNFANQRNIDNFEKKDTKDLNSLIAAAKSISDQSAQLTSDLQKHKSSLERE